MIAEQDLESRRIPAEIGHVQQAIKSPLNEMKTEMKGKMEVRLCRELPIYACIIKADDRMWVTNYLCCRTGGMCPTMEIEGRHSELFELYKDELGFLWERAETVIG